MMPNETRKRLLGESLKRVEEIGLGPWIVYEVLRDLELQRVPNWEYRQGVDVPEGEPVVVEAAFEQFSGLMGPDDVEVAVRSLCASNWLYDYVVEDESIVVVVGVYNEPLIRYAAEIELERQLVRRTDYGDVVSPRVRTPRTRVQAAKKRAAGAKSKTDEKREKNRVRREKRSIAKTSKKAFTRGADSLGRKAWRDPEGIEGVAETKLGLWKLFDLKFRESYGYDPGVFRKGVASPKPANQLAAMADEYGVDVAIRAVAYALENWEEWQKLKGDARAPMPSVLWGIRHELCPPIKQGLDPLEEVKRFRKKSKTKKEKLKESEWDGRKKGVGEW